MARRKIDLFALLVGTAAIGAGLGAAAAEKNIWAVMIFGIWTLVNVFCGSSVLSEIQRLERPTTPKEDQP